MASITEVEVEFILHNAETKLGECIRVFGNHPLLGNWKPEYGLLLTTDEASYPRWVAKAYLDMPANGGILEFKYVYDCRGCGKDLYPELQADNRKIAVPGGPPCEFRVETPCLGSSETMVSALESEQAPAEFHGSEQAAVAREQSGSKVNRQSYEQRCLKQEPFKTISNIVIPQNVFCDEDGNNPEFSIAFESDGFMPFRQVFLWEGSEVVVHLKQEDVVEHSRNKFVVVVPPGKVQRGTYQVQVEGCQVFPIENANGENWIKEFTEVTIKRKPRGNLNNGKVKIYFGIHKHMHQPYYNTTDQGYWDGDIDHIFHMRRGPYNYFVPNAIRQHASLPHGGLSTTWSGSLIEQCNRCEAEGKGRGDLCGWKNQLREVAQWKTECGNPRLDFSAFGYFHPLMPLIPDRDIVKQIQWHRDTIQNTFGVPASNVMFPPETAFHVRMIPALKKAGIEAVMYDSIHRYRTCKGYKWGGPGEGMLPPNQSEQENPEVDDWINLNGCWSASRISPQILRPEYVKYEDADGQTHKIIAVPCERYIGNEDARGGYGGWYLTAMGGIYDEMVDSGNFDPKHPPFFILHSDGDNYGGGSEGYYGSNTAGLVEWLQNDDRFELTTVKDYLDRFPPDPENAVHIEPGAWSGANNGDPQFMKWFTDYTEEYSPDLNSWAALTYFQNVVHSIEDAWPDSDLRDCVERLLLLAETSCYWYYTGDDKWDYQVTDACNHGLHCVEGALGDLVNCDHTPPTIFPPWVTPENPGGEAWPFEHGHLTPAGRIGTVHAFIADVAGVAQATLVLRSGPSEEKFAMVDQGPYPSKTAARSTAQYYTVQLPVGLGDARYYIEAQDGRGNIARSSLERVYLP